MNDIITRLNEYLDLLNKEEKENNEELEILNDNTSYIEDSIYFLELKLNISSSNLEILNNCDKILLKEKSDNKLKNFIYEVFVYMYMLLKNKIGEYNRVKNILKKVNIKSLEKDVEILTQELNNNKKIYKINKDRFEKLINRKKFLIKEIRIINSYINCLIESKNYRYKEAEHQYSKSLTKKR